MNRISLLFSVSVGNVICQQQRDGRKRKHFTRIAHTHTHKPTNAQPAHLLGRNSSPTLPLAFVVVWRNSNIQFYILLVMSECINALLLHIILRAVARTCPSSLLSLWFLFIFFLCHCLPQLMCKAIFIRPARRSVAVAQSGFHSPFFCYSRRFHFRVWLLSLTE